MTKTTRAQRRTRHDLRTELLESALHEFAAKGFDGASTRAIAQRADAHQPQINYHFESKEALWAAAVDRLFGELAEALAPIPIATDDAPALAADFAASIRRFVRFAARRPELNRIIVHEAMAGSERLQWMVDRHVRPLHDGTIAIWNQLVDADIAAPIDSAAIHYVLVGAASLPFVNARELRMLSDVEPTDTGFVEAHADGIVAMLLPGLEREPPPTRG
ncbi:MAG: TetR/AcrR family transcriptional regulator [Actinomycetota bacterium]